MTYNEARQKINAILRDLEADTGQHVASIELKRSEVTNIDDQGPHYYIGVVIELLRTPGHDWAV